MVFTNLFDIFTFAHHRKYRISIPRHHTTLAMEAPPSPEQNGPQTAAEGLRKVESEIYKPIDPKNYRPETWKRCANSAMGQVQFSKFVTFVIARFRSQSGRLDEVRPFVALLATEGSFDFMTPALEQIPELWMEP